MSEKVRIPLTEAEALAVEVIELLQETCEHIEVLGSIRRRKPTVGDIEIGCIPRFREGDAVGLFGDVGDPVNMQFEAIRQLRSAGVFGDRLDVNGRPACGERFQRLLCKGFALDVFSCLEPAQWGVIKLIRTGSGDFNKRFVLQWSQGGKILRAGMQIRDGALYDRGVLVPTPEEIDVFKAVGLAYLEPWERET